jgi:hypothetical protein
VTAYTVFGDIEPNSLSIEGVFVRIEPSKSVFFCLVAVHRGVVLMTKNNA